MEVLRKNGRRIKNIERVWVLGFFFFTTIALLLLRLCFFYSANGVMFAHWPVGGSTVGRGLRLEVQGIGASGGEGCDWFEGEWVWDDKYPLYKSTDCPFIDLGFRCSENGRPDNFYAKWRWKPSRCNLPRFDANHMLEKLRNRRLVFVGDSIGRNQWESLLCLLASAVTNKSSIYEMHGNPITKHMGSLIFKFKDYNCTVEYFRSPFLVAQGRAPAGAPAEVKSTLRVDTIDWTSGRWRDADLLIFNTGHWWNHEKTVKMGCYFQIGDEVDLGFTVDMAYQIAIATLLDWIHREVNTTRTQVIFRTYSPAHFVGKARKFGNGCEKETAPWMGDLPVSINQWSQFMKPFTNLTTTRSNLELLNVTEMSARRKDGHLSLFYLGPSIRAQRQDCSHWCLPGVPDAWNELLYTLFMRRKQ